MQNVFAVIMSVVESAIAGQLMAKVKISTLYNPKNEDISNLSKELQQIN